MKMIYNCLVAGMLVVSVASPVVRLQARPSAPVHAQVRMTITDAMAYRILEEAIGPLEAQMGTSLTLNGLFAEYKSGTVVISWVGSSSGLEWFRVVHADGGGEVIVSMDDF